MIKFQFDCFASYEICGICWQALCVFIWLVKLICDNCWLQSISDLLALPQFQNRFVMMFDCLFLVFATCQIWFVIIKWLKLFGCPSISNFDMWSCLIGICWFTLNFKLDLWLQVILVWCCLDFKLDLWSSSDWILLVLPQYRFLPRLSFCIVFDVMKLMTTYNFYHNYVISIKKTNKC